MGADRRSRSSASTMKGLTTYTRGHSVVGTANLQSRPRARDVEAPERAALCGYTRLLQIRSGHRAFLGTQRVNETAQLAPDGDSYTSVAISNLFDPSGNLVAGGLRGDGHRDADPHRPDPGSAVDPFSSGSGRPRPRRPGPAAWSPALPGELERQEPTRPVSRTPRRTRAVGNNLVVGLAFRRTVRRPFRSRTFST